MVIAAKVHLAGDSCPALRGTCAGSKRPGGNDRLHDPVAYKSTKRFAPSRIPTPRLVLTKEKSLGECLGLLMIQSTESRAVKLGSVKRDDTPDNGRSGRVTFTDISILALDIL